MVALSVWHVERTLCPRLIPLTASRAAENMRSLETAVQDVPPAKQRTIGVRVIVTGGAGYIGSHACKAIARRGWTLLVVDNLSTDASACCT
jgi:FlaA1/EpsC-like NDP-sugar epimerase